MRMESLIYFDRVSRTQKREKIYAAAALRFMYGDSRASRIFSPTLLYLSSRNALFSKIYGNWQSLSITRKKIAPFIKRFEIDASEFLHSPDSFGSFNDFFIRKLKPSARPLYIEENGAVIPADGRYRFYPNVAKSDGFVVKGEKFDLSKLLEDAQMAERYVNGTMVLARLCPSDYHRFHFPCDCTPGPARVINGWLYSVNPIAVRKNIQIFTQNKRVVTQLETRNFGTVLFIEIGATNVGSIQQTYLPYKEYSKGAEKGYFSFGASALILLFEPGRLVLDPDLLVIPPQQMEIRCLLGQSLGRGIENQ